MIINRPKTVVEARMKAIRANYIRRYRKTGLREKLYKKQHGLCALGKSRLPRLVRLQHIDHVTPVRYYATGDWTVKEAAAIANAETNLHLLCYHCNIVKNNQDLEEQPWDPEYRCGDGHHPLRLWSISKIETQIRNNNKYLRDVPWILKNRKLTRKEKNSWRRSALDIKQTNKQLRALLRQRQAEPKANEVLPEDKWKTNLI
jgi:5-methylcytosine-specific restriction endonuclease McrA